MSRLVTSLLLSVLFAATLVLPALSVDDVAQEPPMKACEDGAFSTEEDFITTGPEPYDGDPIISDGDLLSPKGSVCARNAELLANHYPQGRPPADLGLDAADIVDITDNVVAFSTELDDPLGGFTAGDLLFTNGAVVANVALVSPFEISYDIGLDAVQLVGAREDVIQFLNEASRRTRDAWVKAPSDLAGMLRQHNVDIWFSIEGTHRAGNRPILDGDLLSATGTIVAGNSSLLPPAVPAGLPSRGVDFGLDAVAAAKSDDQVREGPDVYFSTEILFRGQPGFTDGDVLRGGNGVITRNDELIQQFDPKADFLGLDALDLPLTRIPPPTDPNIQKMCGERLVADFQGGSVLSTAAAGTGLFRKDLATTPPGEPPRRPCGEYVPIDGYLPDSGVKRFRVAYRPASDLVEPAVGTASGIRTNWVLSVWDSGLGYCRYTGSLDTDANGWMDAAAYLDAKAGGPSTGFCTNSSLRLAVWDTAGHTSGFGPADPDGHYRLWLEWYDNANVPHREPVDHSIQLDNTKPKINVHPDGTKKLKVTLPDGTTTLDACGEAPPGTSTFKVYADFEDAYYWGYHLIVKGGNPPKSIRYPLPPPASGWHDYYDGTPEVSKTDDTGTAPDGSIVHLRDIDMNDLGKSFTDCCYVLDLRIRDAAIRHSFNGRTTNDNSGSNAWWDSAFITFSAAPGP